MKCPKCGYENDDNAYFCEGCGNKLKGNTGVENNQTDNAKFVHAVSGKHAFYFCR